MDKNKLFRVLAEQRDNLMSLPVTIQRHVDLMPFRKSPELIAIISGVRRCGKSTLLRQMAVPNAGHNPLETFYMSFEDPRLQDFRDSDFEVAYQLWCDQLGFPPRPGSLMLFDEIQDAPGWERWLNYFSSQKKMRVVATGSNSGLLSSELATHLTGRSLVLHLTPFSFFEMAAHHQNNIQIAEFAALQVLWLEYLNYGGFPRVAIDKNPILLPEYFRDIVYRDIMVRHGVRNKEALLDLGSILMSNNSRLINISRLTREIGIQRASTLKRYIAYFEEVFLFKELRMFSHSRRKQLRSAPKCFAVDHAMARSLSRTTGEIEGGLLETIVLHELHRKFKNAQIYYWKSADDFEVDFLLIEGRKPRLAVQVAKSIHHLPTRDRELRGLWAARTELQVPEHLLLTEDDPEKIKAMGLEFPWENVFSWCANS